METFLDALHKKGVPAVHLSMVTANASARAFYDRLGFGEIEVPGCRSGSPLSDARRERRDSRLYRYWT
ncbi:hypothetical protein SALBM311S_04165 [Streptomyces alboniger]